MLIYWSLFLIPALAAASPYRLDRASQRLIITVVGIILVVLIGLRDQVGHDWGNYIKIFNRLQAMNIFTAIGETEPGYAVLNVISAQLGWGVYGVNFVCGAIFVSGFIAFLRRQPNFWLTLSLSVPVLVIGIAMGGTRQATALGFLMFAFNAFQDRKLIRFIVFILLGVLFHRSVAAFLIFAFFIGGRLSLWPLIAGGVVFFLLGVFVLRDAVNYYQDSYVGTDIVATGALPRIALSAVAAGIFIYIRKQWHAWFDDGVLYTLAALTIFLMTLGVFNAQAATDRMLMYLLPIQVAIFSRAPLFLRQPMSRRLAAVGAFVLYGAVLFVWLNFSSFAQKSWLPYRNILWGY